MYSSFAQTYSYKYEVLKGRFVDNISDQVIPSVNIFNESKRTWDYANAEGYFNIWVDIGDTLMFTAVGYLSTVLYVTDSLVKNDAVIKLESRSYEIGEVVIKSLKPYSQFKQDVINLELAQTELDSVTEYLTYQSKEAAIESDYEREVEEIFAREKGTLFVINAGTLGSLIKNKRKEKQKTNPKKAYKNKEQQQIIASKFNGDIVHNITKISDNDLIKFMTFCNFSAEYLVTASPYDIAKAISDKFKEYKDL